MRDALHDPVNHGVPQLGQVGIVPGQVLRRQLDGRAQPHDGGQVFRPRPLAPLLGAAQHKPADGRALADVQRPYALGCVKLVPRQGQQVHRQRGQVDGHRADGLHRVGVHQRAVGLGDAAQFLNGLQGADFVVGHHHRYQGGIRPHGLFQLRRVHQPLPVHRQVGHLKALFLQLLGGMEHRVVLDGAGDDVLALVPAGVGRPPQGPVVRFGAAAGKVDFSRLGPQGLRRLLPGLLYRLARLPPRLVHRGGVSVAAGQIGHHGLQHRLGDSGGGRVIHVNLIHGGSLLLSLVRFPRKAGRNP